MPTSVFSGWRDRAGVFAVMVVLTASGPALAGGKRDLNTDLLAANCAVCHGSNGAKVKFIPSLKGMSRVKIAEALQAYKAGNRSATIMNRLAKGLSSAQIDALAKHYGN